MSFSFAVMDGTSTSKWTVFVGKCSGSTKLSHIFIHWLPVKKKSYNYLDPTFLNVFNSFPLVWFSFAMMDNMSASRWTVFVGNCSASTELSHIYMIIWYFLFHIFGPNFSARSHLSAPPHPLPRKEKTKQLTLCPWLCLLLDPVFSVWYKDVFLRVFICTHVLSSILCHEHAAHEDCQHSTNRHHQRDDDDDDHHHVFSLCHDFLLFSVLKLRGYLAVG